MASRSQNKRGSNAVRRKEPAKGEKEGYGNEAELKKIKKDTTMQKRNKALKSNETSNSGALQELLKKKAADFQANRSPLQQQTLDRQEEASFETTEVLLVPRNLPGGNEGEDETYYQDKSEDDDDFNYSELVPNYGEKSEEEQADEIIDLIKSGKVNQIYTKTFHCKPLARRLFVEGIDLLDLTTNRPQNRFTRSRDKVTGKLIFYPTDTTTEIFNTILGNSNKERFYLSACKGIGKSFSLALLVYLLRLRNNTRVLYIHSTADFVNGPFIYLIQEIRAAFPQELEELEISKEKLDEILDIQKSDQQQAEIRNLLRHIEAVLSKKSVDYFRLFDQVNEVLNKRFSTLPAAKDAYELYCHLQKDTAISPTIGQMLSFTNKIAVENVQECPLYAIDWKELTPKAESKFIKDRFQLNLADEGDKALFQRIKGWCAGYFLMAYNLERFFSKNNEKESVAKFFQKMQVDVTNDIRKFLDVHDSEGMTDIKKGDIQKQRRRNLMLAAHSIEYRVEYCGTFNPEEFDGRYFVILSYLCKKIKPLHPLVIDVINKCLTEDPAFMEQVIAEFQDNRAVLGYIFEKLVIKALVLRSDVHKYSMTSLRERSHTNELFLDGLLSHTIYDITDFELREEGLHCPLMFNFEQYDAFITEKKVIKAIQIKLHFQAHHIKDMCAIAKAPNQTQKVSAGNTQEYVCQRLHELLKKEKKNLEVVLVSVGQNPRDSVFKQIKQLSEDCKIKFFYVDAKVMLKALGFSEGSITKLRCLKNCL